MLSRHRYVFCAYGSLIIPIFVAPVIGFLSANDTGLPVDVLNVILSALGIICIANCILIFIACTGIRTPLTAIVILPGVILGVLVTLHAAGMIGISLLLFSGAINWG